MRISATNIPAAAGGTRLTTATDRVAAERKSSAPQDSFQRDDLKSQIIDAEYVEFYSPSATQLQQERRVLDRTLEPTEADSSNPAPPQRPSADGSYPLKIHAAPPPGSYIDTFA